MIPRDNEDARSIKQLITFGIKGLAAYTYHALNLEKEMEEIYSFIYEALAATLDTGLSVEELFLLAMKTGEIGVKAMALLDEANTARYGDPKITEVNTGVRNNPAILISGHDLTDLEELLEQTRGTGNDINELPIVYNISWYEQKAVLVLLALLYLGVRNIHLGPTLPAFLSPNVIKVLADNFGIAGIGTADEDIRMFMASETR